MLLTASSLAALPIGLAAQPVAPGVPSFRLPAVDTAATRPAPEAERLRSEVPAIRIPRELFDRLPSDRASDIVPRLPGVVTSGPPGEARAFGLRGLTPDYTRVQVNGIQLPSAAQTRSFELMNLPGFLLDEVAIIRNPDASTEADGIGGRIALRLRALPEADLSELRFAAGGRDRLFDGRHFTGSALLARRVDERFGFIGAVNFDRRQVARVKDFSELTFQGGPGGAGTLVDERELRDLRNLDAFLQLGWAWDGGQLTLRPYIFDETADNSRRRDTYRRLTRTLDGTVIGGGEETTRVAGLAANLSHALTPGLRLELDAAFAVARFDSSNTNFNLRPNGTLQSSSTAGSRIDDDQYDLGARLAWHPPALPGHELRTGVQIRRLERNSSGGSNAFDAAGRLIGNSNYTADETYFAAFVQDRITLGRLTLSPGLRIEHVALDLDGSRGASSPGFTDLLPSLPAVFRLTETLSLRAAVGRQVNRPKLEEVAPGVTLRGNRTFFGNPSLEPARAWSYDAGVEYATPLVFLSAGVFLRDITDVVEAQEIIPNQFRVSNVGDGRVWGFELEQRLNAGLLGMEALSPLTLRLNQTFLNSRVNDPDTGPRRFSEVPRFAANIGVEWNDRGTGTLLSANLNHVSTRVISSYDGAGVRRYKELNPTNFIDLLAEQRVARGVSVFATAQNLLNQRRDEFELTNGALARTAVIDSGRTFFVGVRITL